MSTHPGKLLKRILGRKGPLFRSPMNPDKKDLIDFAFKRNSHPPRSFADLGGVWGVDGAYTFYALDTYTVDRAILIDTDFTEAVKNKGRRYHNLTSLCMNFGSPKALERMSSVDLVILFDILLHQVSPDWDEILDMYAPNTRQFAIYNQQYLAAEKTVRLLDLGRDEYFKNVPHSPDHPTYRELFERMHETHPQHQRPWRDIHNVWQWGITDQDLFDKMRSLGFVLDYYKNCGTVGSLSNFENHGFVFRKK